MLTHEPGRWHGGANMAFLPLRGPYDHTGPDSATMLAILLDDIVDRYTEFAGECYEIEVNRRAVEPVVRHGPLTDAVAQALNPELTAATIRDDIAAMCYSIATS